MKQICTQIALFCLLIIAQKSNAQFSGTCIASSSFLTPSMYGYGTMDSIKASNGYTSTNTTNFNVYPKGVAAQSTTITSPALQYPTNQSSVYFKINFDIANNPGASSNCNGTVVIKYGSTTVTATLNFTIINGGGDYYFKFDLPAGQQVPANVPFSISLTLNIPNNEKAVTAYTFTSNAPVSSHTVLPVKFTSFTAQISAKSVGLHWAVATEEDIAGYEIQKSVDGRIFTKIGSVAANNASSYNFTDSKTIDLAYYRVKSIDHDGKYGYSTIVIVNGQQSSVVLKAFPMPVQNELTIQHNLAGNSSKIELITVDGRLVKSVLVSSGTQQTTLDMSSSKAGVYVVRFINDTTTETLKVIKQ